MKKVGVGCAVLGGLVLIALFLLITAGVGYNRLVRLSQATDKQWAQVQNVYQRRADLVPNLVATVSGAANFEKSTLTEVTAARASVGRASSQVGSSTSPTDANQLAEYDKAQSQLGSALSRLLVVVEGYPQLRATENFKELQSQLEGTENRISVERGRFNEAVQAYNSAVKSFPAVLYAGALGFPPKPYFTAAPGAENAPKVQFDFNKPAAEQPQKR